MAFIHSVSGLSVLPMSPDSYMHACVHRKSGRVACAACTEGSLAAETVGNGEELDAGNDALLLQQRLSWSCHILNSESLGKVFFFFVFIG